MVQERVCERSAARCKVYGVRVVVEEVERVRAHHVLADFDVCCDGGPWVGREKDLERYENYCGLVTPHDPADGESLIVWRVVAMGS